MLTIAENIRSSITRMLRILLHRLDKLSVDVAS